MGIRYIRLNGYVQVGDHSFTIDIDFDMEPFEWEGNVSSCKLIGRTLYFKQLDGYAWDGATGAIDTENFMTPSAEHDLGCELILKHVLPECFIPIINKRLWEELKLRGMGRFRRLYVRWATRNLCDPRKNRKKIYEAP
jgi:hypothetical protein